MISQEGMSWELRHDSHSMSTTFYVRGLCATYWRDCVTRSTTCGLEMCSQLWGGRDEGDMRYVPKKDRKDSINTVEMILSDPQNLVMDSESRCIRRIHTPMFALAVSIFSL